MKRFVWFELFSFTKAWPMLRSSTSFFCTSIEFFFLHNEMIFSSYSMCSKSWTPKYIVKMIGSTLNNNWSGIKGFSFFMFFSTFKSLLTIKINCNQINWHLIQLNVNDAYCTSNNILIHRLFCYGQLLFFQLCWTYCTNDPRNLIIISNTYNSQGGLSNIN